MSRDVARQYAKAFFDAAQRRGLLAACRDEIGAVLDVFRQEPAIRKIWDHPFVSGGEKRDLLEKLFGERVSSFTLDLLSLLVEKKRERILPDLFVELNRLVDEAQNVVEARVVSARPLPEAILAEVRQRLGEVLGRNVRLACSTDPSLGAGLLVQVGDRRLDGTLRTRLAQLREALRAGGATTEGGRP